MAHATFNKGATIIAVRPISALGGRRYEPGDVVPWRHLALGERRVGQMINQRLLGELSQENFDFALRQRTDGSLPKGLTEAGLEAIGIGFAPPEDTPPAPEAKPEPSLNYSSRQEHRGYTLGAVKRGATTGYDIFNADGQRLNPGGPLNGMKQVDKFISSLEDEAARLAKDTCEEPVSGGDDPVPADGVNLGWETYGDQDTATGAA